MNRINKQKLRLSKWTALKPLNREKHFLVTRVITKDEGTTHVLLEAVYSKREMTVPWQTLKDDTHWRMGWL